MIWYLKRSSYGMDYGNRPAITEFSEIDLLDNPDKLPLELLQEVDWDEGGLKELYEENADIEENVKDESIEISGMIGEYHYECEFSQNPKLEANRILERIANVLEMPKYGIWVDLSALNRRTADVMLYLQWEETDFFDKPIKHPLKIKFTHAEMHGGFYEVGLGHLELGDPNSLDKVGLTAFIVGAFVQHHMPRTEVRIDNKLITFKVEPVITEI